MNWELSCSSSRKRISVKSISRATQQGEQGDPHNGKTHLRVTRNRIEIYIIRSIRNLPLCPLVRARPGHHRHHRLAGFLCKTQKRRASAHGHLAAIYLNRPIKSPSLSSTRTDTRDSDGRRPRRATREPLATSHFRRRCSVWCTSHSVFSSFTRLVPPQQLAPLRPHTRKRRRLCEHRYRHSQNSSYTSGILHMNSHR